MIHIAIVDDDESYVAQIRQYLEQYERDSGELIKISAFHDGDNIVHKYRSRYDVILMDVEMPFMDGISAAEEIRKTDSEVVIVFIANTPSYAIRGYAVEALDYLLKPISYITLSRCLNRAIDKMKKRLSNAITVNVKGGLVRINVADVYYVESRGHSLIYYTTSGEYETASTMKETEDALSGMGFFRASKWYLVNLAHVDSLQDGCVKLANKSLSVSRAKRKEFFDVLAAYWGR